MSNSEIPRQIEVALTELIRQNPPEGATSAPRFGTAGGNGFTVSFHTPGEGWKVFGRPVPYAHVQNLRKRSATFSGVAQLMWDFIRGEDVGIAPEIREQVSEAMREFIPTVIQAVSEGMRPVVEQILADMGIWTAEPAPFEADEPKVDAPAALDEDGNPVKDSAENLNEPAASEKEEPKKPATRKKASTKKAESA